MFKKTIVIGSGPSGTFFSKAIIENNQSITMIDLGYTKKDNALKSDLNNINARLTQKKNFVEKDFKKKNKIIEKNFSVVGSLAEGGLSNVWGGGNYRINYNFYLKKLKFFKAAFKGVLKTFRKKSYSKKNELLNLLQSNNASKEISFFDEEIMYDKSTNGIYNSKNDIQALKKNKKFTYIKGFFVEKIKKIPQGYELKCIKKEKIIFIRCKYLVLACGTIGTTRLLLDYLSYKKKIRLFHTYNMNFIGFFKKSIKNKNFDKVQALMQYKFTSPYIKKIKNNENCYGSIGFISKDIILMTLKSFPNLVKKLFVKIAYMLKDRIIIGNCFFPHFLTVCNIELINKDLVISGQFNDNYKFIIKKVQKDIKGIFGNILPFIFFKLMPIGSDVHYFGTLINRNNKKFGVNDNCQFNKNKNLYVVDGSVIKQMDNKFPTQIMMINSYRVGLLLTKKLNNEN